MSTAAKPDRSADVAAPFEVLTGSHILLRIDDFKYSGKIVIPETAKRKPTTGVVAMVGPDVKDIEVGTRVLYSQFAGNLLVFEGLDPCRVISREEVLAVLKRNAPRLEAEGS